MSNELHRPELAGLEEVEWEEIPLANRWSDITDWHTLRATVLTLSAARALVEYLLAEGYSCSSCRDKGTALEQEYRLPQTNAGTSVRVRYEPLFPDEHWRWQVAFRVSHSDPWQPFSQTVFEEKPPNDDPIVLQARSEHDLGLVTVQPTLFW